ncbi:MAG: spermidine synthase [Phycisphaerae bacterium]
MTRTLTDRPPQRPETDTLHGAWQVEAPEDLACNEPRTSVRADAHPGGPAALGLFAATILVGAMLLFLVQPMVGKMVLPTLGGTPAVWNTCMLFFQGVLLAGYGYAHISTAYLGLRRQAVVHLLVLVLPWAVLPIVVAGAGPANAGVNPVWWLLVRLSATVGLPFFVVATSGPLLQKWFSGTNHRLAGDPFFLYAASNAGSLGALLAYPLIVEPLMPLAGQSRLWSWGYGLYVVLAALCVRRLWRATKASPNAESDSSPVSSPRNKAKQRSTVAWRQRAAWLLASFVPSSLMLAVTAHITSNLAPVPLLWVLPLALYLVTFILVFARRRPLPHGVVAKVLPFLLPPTIALVYLDLPHFGWLAVVLHLVTFFVAAMVCHGKLADARPGPRHLTEYYVWMSVGGALGGLFNAVLAPMVFDTLVEYPLSLVAAGLLLPCCAAKVAVRRAWRGDLLGPAVMAALAAGLVVSAATLGWTQGLAVRAVILGPLALIGFSFKDRPVRFALGMAVFAAAVGTYHQQQQGRTLLAQRNFFGVKRVALDVSERFRVLAHGTTLHGKQFLEPNRRSEPLSYYHRQGPLGDVFAGLDAAGRRGSIAVVGLGAGSIAAYAGPGQTLTFYEIDPQIAEIARDPQYFSFLSECRARWDVVIGDGRLALGDTADAGFDLIVLDAFSSDAIPTHLLTREAVDLYLQKLAPGGILAFHISNRYLDLEPLVAALASQGRLHGRVRRDLILTDDELAAGREPSIWAVLTRSPQTLTALGQDDRWKPLALDPAKPAWTDTYSSILRYFVWR